MNTPEPRAKAVATSQNAATVEYEYGARARTPPPRSHPDPNHPGAALSTLTATPDRVSGAKTPGSTGNAGNAPQTARKPSGQRCHPSAENATLDPMILHSPE